MFNLGQSVIIPSSSGQAARSTRICEMGLLMVTFDLATGRPVFTLQWRHNWRLNCVSNHQHHDCLLNCLFWRRSKKTSKLCVTGLCEGNSPVTGEFPAQMASNAENVFIWWRHHKKHLLYHCPLMPSTYRHRLDGCSGIPVRSPGGCRSRRTGSVLAPRFRSCKSAVVVAGLHNPWQASTNSHLHLFGKTPRVLIQYNDVVLPI